MEMSSPRNEADESWEDSIVSTMERIRKDEILLDFGEVMEYLRIGRMTLYRFINRGDLQGYKIGGKWVFKKRDVQNLVREVPVPSKN